MSQKQRTVRHHNCVDGLHPVLKPLLHQLNGSAGKALYRPGISKSGSVPPCPCVRLETIK